MNPPSTLFLKLLLAENKSQHQKAFVLRFFPNPKNKKKSFWTFQKSWKTHRNQPSSSSMLFMKLSLSEIESSASTWCRRPTFNQVATRRARRAPAPLLYHITSSLIAFSIYFFIFLIFKISMDPAELDIYAFPEALASRKQNFSVDCGAERSSTTILMLKYFIQHAQVTNTFFGRQTRLSEHCSEHLCIST